MLCGLGRKLSKSFSRHSRREGERRQKVSRRSRSLESLDREQEISGEFSTVYEERVTHHQVVADAASAATDDDVSAARGAKPLG